MEEFKRITENPYILNLIVLFIGGLITHIFSKIKNKSGVLGYFSNLIGLDFQKMILFLDLFVLPGKDKMFQIYIFLL
jgi:hypothetical protein